MSETDISPRQKTWAILRIARYRPLFTSLIGVGSFLVAVVEGIGLSFIIPIIELLQSNGNPRAEAEGATYVFVQVYQLLGIPFTLGFIVLGVVLVISVRYTSSFVVDWLRTMLTIQYLRDLQLTAFDQVLDARVSYFDQTGTDDILNAIVTQIPHASDTINQVVDIFRNMLLILMYLVIAFYLAPLLAVATIVLFGGVTYVSRFIVEPGYAIGDRVADANERIHSMVQAGTQGIRDVKLFQMNQEIYDNLADATEQFSTAAITLHRNNAFIQNFHQFLSAVTIFLLVFAGHRFTTLSMSSLGMFLFAMFRLAPQISSLVHLVYKIEGNLPHFVRTHEFVEEMKRYEKANSGDRPAPRSITSIEFRDVAYSYPNSETVLRDLSLEIQRNDHVAFVGHSGAGKSTIVSLLTRFYEPDSGRITADGTPIAEFELESWRSKFAIIRQQPFLFNDTLRYNLTIGNRDVPDEELDRVCRIARVSEFYDDLPNGYETVLGEDGVQLSGGQRQRVALARALLRDAEILILDEATSDLDSDIERQVHRAIESMENEYTIISIAHRLSTVTDADRIYTLADGRVVQQGTHEELVDCAGIYSRLYSLQSS